MQASELIITLLNHFLLMLPFLVQGSKIFSLVRDNYNFH